MLVNDTSEISFGILSLILKVCSVSASRFAATWKQEWKASGPTRVHSHVSDPGEGVKGEDLSRKHWTTLNRLRTVVGRYRASMKKWGLADSAACECGEPEQTADHIINSCPLHRPPSEAGLFEVGPLTRALLQQTELTIMRR